MNKPAKPLLLALIMAILFPVSGSHAQEIKLLKNIGQLDNYGSSNPGRFTIVGDLMYFVATTETHGEELWAMPANTREPYLVKDIKAGPVSSELRALSVFGNKLLFTVTAGETGIETWVSDGTGNGTRRLIGNGSRFTDLNSAVVLNNEVYFLATSTSDRVKRLWKSDASGAQIEPVDSARYSTSFVPNGMVASGRNLFLSISEDGKAPQLWKFERDGRMNLIIGADSSSKFLNIPKLLTGHNGDFYAVAYDSKYNQRWLWYINDTGVIAQPLMNLSKVEEFVYASKNELSINENIFFFVGVVPGDVSRLWRTNGTPEGTYELRDEGMHAWSDPTSLHIHNGLLFFTAKTGSKNRRELWSTSGLEQDITRLTWETETTYHQVSRNTAFVSQQDHLFYFSAYIVSVSRLMAYNLTTKANRVVKDFKFEQQVIGDWGIWFKDRLYFSAREFTDGQELWSSNSTIDSAYLYRNINYRETGSNPRYLTDLNGRLLFTAEDYIHGQELWIETLDEDSAKMLKDIRHGPDGSYPIFLTNIDRKNKVVFAAVDSAHGTELWVTDGTPDSTKLLKEFTPGEMGTRFTQIVGHRRGAFFAISLEESVELWRTDGSETGTQRVRSFPLNTKIYLFENTKQFVYFVERNSNGTNRLWITDGSVAGTQPLTSFCPCNNPPYTIRLAEHQGKIYFDGSSLQSHQLWTSNLTDGYAAPVQQAEHIVPVRFAIYHNKVYFVGQDTNSNVSVWHTDGTDQGTISMPGTLGNPDFNNLVSAGDNLFYITQDLQFGLSSLWVLNRSEEPLISPANQLMGIRPQDAISVNNDLYFPATDGSTGYELWRSTGTIDSTYLVQDLNTGSGSAYPRNFIHIGRRLYFVADHLTRGTEVFYIDVSEAVKKSVPVSPTIFPNPAGNTVSVQVSEEFSDDWLKVDVYNMQGAKLISKRLESNVLTLDLSLLPPGVYLVRVNNSHGSRLIKL